MTDLSDQSIIESWHINAAPWAKAIANEEIVSRQLVTNEAILDAIEALHPMSVLDIGCGEGWLSRKLVKQDRYVLGVDAIPTLIEVAKCSGGADFEVLSYEQIASIGISKEPFELAVCNFSLFGKETVDQLIQAIPRHLTSSGYLVIQTLHPPIACGDKPYIDGWREGSWAGFSSEFQSPPPWYFRTLNTWMACLHQAGFHVLECREPLHPTTQQPASMIFIAKVG